MFELDQTASGVTSAAMPRLGRSLAEQAQVGAAGPDFLEALARGLRVIEAFNRERRPLTLADIAKVVGLPRASVRRTLATLVHLGYAETDERRFRLTPRILDLASAYLASNAISGILQPAIERMSQETNEACSAAVLDGEDVVMIAHAAPKRVIEVSAQIGFRLPAFATSLGRVLLAALDDEALDAFLARAQPRKLAPATVVDKRALRRAILKARQDGFSFADQEAEVGFRSISVPLRRRDGKVVASLNIGAHSERCPAKTMHAEFLPRLRDAADTLQRQLI
jgi:IclR family transcriptional regulator, pca regulon regulatory protein